MGFTTRYQLPFPAGTDKVMDGDNAMQALAQKTEDTLYNNRIWVKSRQATDTFGSGGYNNVMGINLTGCPAGVTVFFSAVFAFSATPGNSNIWLRAQAGGGMGGIDPGIAVPTNSQGDNSWITIPLVGGCQLINPGAGINFEAYVGPGVVATVDGTSHVVVWRVT